MAGPKACDFFGAQHFLKIEIAFDGELFGLQIYPNFIKI
jgi:hypothetical protein